MEYLYLCPLCLGIVGLFVYVEKNKKYVLADVLKGLASLMFVLLGYLSSKFCFDATFSNKILVGLFLGFVADILLNLRYVFKKKGQLVFLIGILVFLAGHISYLLALVSKVNDYSIGLWIGIILTMGTMFLILRVIQANLVFKIFGVFYLASVMMMTCVAWLGMIENFSNAAFLFALGASLFLISDIVLILNTFRTKSNFSMRITNITLYYIGQLLIALSLQWVK